MIDQSAPSPRRFTAVGRLCFAVACVGALLVSGTAVHAQPESNLPGRIEYGYRVDTRPPDVVFRDGFRAQGRNLDLLAHVSGESCQAGNDGWISTTSSIAQIRDFIVQQLANGQLSHTGAGQLNAWLYTIRLDHTFVSVSSVFEQVTVAASQGTQGYLTVQEPILEQLIYLHSIGPTQEVVSPHSISHNRILTASSLTFDPRTNHLTVSANGTRNAAFVVPGPSEQFRHRVDSSALNDILPPRSINQASFSPQVAMCIQTCDGADASQRQKRSLGGSAVEYCAAKPSKAQALIGSED
jgi:pertussis toxin subunit 1